MLSNQKNLNNKALLLEQYKTALFLSELLEQIYLSYWENHNLIAGLRKQQMLYRDSLNNLGYRVLTPLQKAIVPTSWSLLNFINENHPFYNYLRLLILRIRRLLVAITRLNNVIKEYKGAISAIENVLGPIFAYLSWIAFLPRLLSQTWMLFKHTVPGWWMSADEKKIHWTVRLHTQLSESWALLFNDFNWVITGILCTFVFIGSPVAIYLTLAIFYMDVILSGLKAVQVLTDMYCLKNKYQSSIDPSNPQQIELFNAYIKGIEEHLSYEKKRVALSVCNSGLLFLAMCLTLPGLIAAQPLWVPISCGILLVLITLSVFCIGKYLERSAPSVDCLPVKPSSGITRLSLFAHDEDLNEDCKSWDVSLPFAATN